MPVAKAVFWDVLTLNDESAAWLSSARVAATRLYEAGITSNRKLVRCGESVPGSCTHRPSHAGIPSFSLLYSTEELIDPSLTLKVIGHQWYWSYEYSDFVEYSDGESINFDSYMLSSNDLPLGSFRLLEVDNRVILPINTHIRVLVTAADVLHSWAVPSFGFKIDACPGRLSQGICLVIQIVTGIFLAMHYCANVDLAFDSVEHIMTDVNSGWILRGRLWASGVVIFLLMMATAFMGYVLPWGQMSFWGATVITNLFSAIPFVGSSIVEWLWGGFSVRHSDNYIPANPMSTPAHIVPEWYFLPFYAILRSIPDKLGGVVAMVGLDKNLLKPLLLRLGFAMKIAKDGRILFIVCHVSEFSPKRSDYIPAKIEKLENSKRR
ncbi:hypothetical protein Lal_00015405 [Lupinus albus]|nr:hypothetical protein Lal_00015405 [Lupinus albus]